VKRVVPAQPRPRPRLQLCSSTSVGSHPTSGPVDVACPPLLPLCSGRSEAGPNNGQITGNATLEVFSEVIPPFNLMPRSVLEVSGLSARCYRPLKVG